ncbi:penicillin acylase family protein [Agromyces agglutinans]|nr:penicillin acylase family protein [Agromyces agglutinans]
MAEAELFRDALGVPHLRAADELGLAEAQGRVTALDRAWQIEVDRWRAEGRLAERIGPAGLEWDRFARRIRLAETAERAYDALEPDDRAWVDAYVRGVNAGLPEGRRRSANAPGGEFATFASVDVFGAEAPEPTPWPAWAPLGVFLVAHVLFSPFPNLLWRAHLAATLGDEHVDRFTPGVPAAAGSNAWAIHGSRTPTGAPLLAGDPHRLLELPGVYQQVRLACPEYDVVGLAFPGVPGVPHFGHTGSAAWGITNAIAHSADVFRERLRDIDGRVEALGADGWEPVDRRVEAIHVRDGASEQVVALETARGPVVVDGPGGCFSVRLPARVDADLGFAAFRRLLRARSVADVASAFERWVDPVNRVLAADASGDVLRFTAGRAPQREVHERRLPLDAWEVGADPGGTTDPAASGPTPLPPPEPVTSVAVDANERPDRPGHDLGYAYPSSARARRIRTLLADVHDASPADMSSIHADVLDERALALVGRLRDALARPGAPAPSAAGADLAALFFEWDGNRGADSVIAARFAAWHSALVRRLAAHPSLAPLHAPHGMGAIFDPWFSVAGRVGDALESLLDARALGIDGRAELVAALEEAAASEETTAWGDRHRLHPLHVLADVPGADVPRMAPVALGGAGDTVRCTGSVPGVTDAGFRGSVARWVWDLADRPGSRWNVPFGASGVPGEVHFDDQLAAWSRGETTPIVTDWHRLARQEDPWAG